VHLARTIELHSATPSYPKAPRGVIPGARSGPKHRQLARQVGGVSLIQASSMAIIFQHKIALRPRSVFCFGTISSVADEEGILHHIADPPEKKPSPKISEKTGTRQQIVQPPAPRAKTPSCKPGQRIHLPEEPRCPPHPWKGGHGLRGKKEANRIEARQAALLAPSPSKEDRKKLVTTATPFYPDVLFIGGRVESSPISDDEPTMPGEEPPQREARRRRNQRRNIQRHHEAGERDPMQPVSRDEISEVGETPDERVFRERRNSRQRDRRQAQEQVEQDARQRQENPLFA
jgi:hypothetical protein